MISSIHPSLLGILKFVAAIAASETVAAVIVVVGGGGGDGGDGGDDAAAAAESETGEATAEERSHATIFLEPTDKCRLLCSLASRHFVITHCSFGRSALLKKDSVELICDVSNKSRCSDNETKRLRRGVCTIVKLKKV